MDFAALLQQHTQQQQEPNVVGGLNGSLSSSRDGDDRPRRHFAQSVRGGRRRGPGRQFHHQPHTSGGVDEPEIGTIRCNATWGEYPTWKLEWKSPEPGNMSVTFEAKGEDNIVVALSPTLGSHDPMYEIVIGGWKNTKSIIRTVAQGPERAVSTEKRTCTSNEFRPYWVRLRDGVLSCGVGTIIGQGLIIAWKDPTPLTTAQFASFTTWDRTVVYRNIVVDKDDTETMEDIEFTGFVPDYLEKFEAEREKARTRAERFGIEYVDPNVARLAEDLLSPEERARLRQLNNPRAAREGGFVTGFDPTSEAERAKAEARAKRFNTGATAAAPEEKQEEEYLSREKREQRAQRFQMPVKEDFDQANKVARVSSRMRVPRKDPAPDDQRRPDAIHVYGAFDGVYTKDVMQWFEEYGASHVDWLHDCAVNVVFDDEVTARRAMTGLGSMIPDLDPTAPTATSNDEGEEKQEESMQMDDDEDPSSKPPALRSNGWMHGSFGGRTFLIRYATVTDVKVSMDSGYRTTIGYRGGRRGGRRPRRGRGGYAASTRMNESPAVTGSKRRMDDEGDVMMDDTDNTKKARADSL